MILYQAWFEHRGWTAIVRVDRVTWFLHLAALATLAFEFVFIALVWVRWLRPWLFAGGLLFHNCMCISVS